MITETTSRNIETIGQAAATADYYIDPKNIAHVCSVLRNLYKDPLKAVVREYCSNAVDAHIQSGVPDTEIHVHLPTQFEPWFAVRDFGTGLSRDDAAKLLFGYGSSGDHKRTSNTQIGGFGIGGKSAFAIADAFTYTIIHGGTKQVWSCYLDEHDLGKAILASEEPTNEPTGIEVRIPIQMQYNTEGLFQNYVKEVFTFLPYRPVCTPELKIPYPPEPLMLEKVAVKVTSSDGTEETKTVQVGIYRHETINEYTEYRSLSICVGGTLYKVALDGLQFGEAMQDATSRAISLTENCIIHAPVGFVTLAPSREEIQLSAKSKKIISAVLTHLLSDSFRDTLSTKFKAKVAAGLNCRQIAEHMAAIPGVNLKHPWATKSGLFIGKEKDKHSSTLIGTGRLQAVSQDSKLKYNPDFNTHTGNAIAFIDVVVLMPADKALTESTVETAMHKLAVKELGDDKWNKSKEIHIAAIPESWFDEGVTWLTDGSVRVHKYADLPAVNDSLVYYRYYGRRSRRWGSSSTSSGPKTKYAQHSRKLVKLVGGGSTSQPSSFWEACKAAEVTKSGGGIYFIIDSFAIEPRHNGGLGFAKWNLEDLTSQLKSIVDMPNSRLPELSTVYGVRVKDAPSLKEEDGFISFTSYVRDAFRRDLESGVLDYDALVTLLYLHDVQEHNRRTGQTLTGVIMGLRKHAVKSSELSRRFAKWKLIGDCSVETQQWYNIILRINHAQGCVVDSVRTLQLESMFGLDGAEGIPTPEFYPVVKEARLAYQKDGISAKFRLWEDVDALVKTCPMLAQESGLIEFASESVRSTRSRRGPDADTSFSKYAAAPEFIRYINMLEKTSKKKKAKV